MVLAFVAALGMQQGLNRNGVAPVALAGSVAPDGVVSTGEPIDVRFGLCSEGTGDPCVVDGDTLRYTGRRIRLLGIDTPELHPARCAQEVRLGQAAKLRMQALVNAGPFALVAEGRDRDRFGRDLRRAVRGDTDLGAVLIREGLARPYDGARSGWC